MWRRSFIFKDPDHASHPKRARVLAVAEKYVNADDAEFSHVRFVLD